MSPASGSRGGGPPGARPPYGDARADGLRQACGRDWRARCRGGACCTASWGGSASLRAPRQGGATAASTPRWGADQSPLPGQEQRLSSGEGTELLPYAGAESGVPVDTHEPLGLSGGVTLGQQPEVAAFRGGEEHRIVGRGLVV